MNKLKTVITAAALAAATGASAMTNCSSWVEVRTALEAGGSVRLTNDIAQASSEKVLLSGSQKVTVDLNGYKLTSTSTGCVFDLTGSSAKLTITDSAGGGVIDGQNVERTSLSGGCVTLKSGCEFVFEGGTIQNFKNTAWNGGAIYNEGIVTMNGGAISNCTATSYGGAVYVTGAFTLNGGVISGCETTKYDANVAYGGAVAVASGGTFTMNAGELINNRSGAEEPNFGWGSAVNVASGGTSKIYGGVITNNTSFGDGPIHADGTSLVYVIVKK